jgi:hypothetical protein
MSEAANVTVKCFGILHSLRRNAGQPSVFTVEVPAEGLGADALAESLGLPLEQIEGVFCEHRVQGLNLLVCPGATIAYVPRGTPGPHRFALGLYHAGKDDRSP